jgi:glycosyltransferase involved in cell wall biosynthesis
MKILSTSYTNTAEFDDPEQWLKRISFYTGILEELTKLYEVESIEQINYTGRLIQKKVTYHFLNFKMAKLYLPGKLHDYIKKINPDVVLINGLIFPLQITQLRLKLGKAVKLIVLHRGEKPYKGWRKFLQQLADKVINAYLFTSAEFGEEWTRHGNISNPKKIHEVIQASSSFAISDKFAARSALGITAPVVFLCVGRLDANKDPQTVVKAFIQFLKFQPLARLYLIYQTEDLLNLIKSIIDKASLPPDAITLAGKIPNSNLQAWYNAADFIVSGSHYEGSGIAVCEAMSCGCIPVVTNIKSFRRMTGPGKCGLLYEPGNEKDLLAALLKAISLNMIKEKEKVLQQFKDELSFNAIAKKLDAVIKKL